MTLTPRTKASFIASDDFGAMVAEHCGADPSSLLSEEGFLAIGRPAGPVVLVGAQSDEGIRESLDRRGAEWGIPTVGLSLRPTRIICGPAVIPGQTACYRCYRARVAQHSTGSPMFGEEASSSGLTPGFATFHVALAAGLISLALQELTLGPLGLGGTVRTISLVTGGVSSAAVVAVDRCTRCGSRFENERDPGLFTRELEGINS